MKFPKLKFSKWRLAWGVIIPVGMLCMFLAGYFLNNTWDCMMQCSMQRAILIQEGARCQSQSLPKEGPEPN